MRDNNDTFGQSSSKALKSQLRTLENVWVIPNENTPSPWLTLLLVLRKKVVLIKFPQNESPLTNEIINNDTFGQSSPKALKSQLRTLEIILGDSKWRQFFSFLKLWQMVFCYHNCSNVLWEKIVLVWGKKLRKKFANSRS